MKLFTKRTDGGPLSNVTGFWLIEWKGAFSVALLRFSQGSREAFHSHAFHSISWVLRGHLREHRLLTDREVVTHYRPSLWPLITTRKNLHKVFGVSEQTWVLTFRGPWTERWNEVLPGGCRITLTHGRRQVVE